MYNIRKSLFCRSNLLLFPTLTLLSMQVQAEQSTATKRDDVLVISAKALKLDTSLQETPKSVSIITQKELEIHTPQKLDEALRYTSSVVAQPYGADNKTDWFKVRGFDAATYLDNSRLFRDGHYTWLLEPYGFENIEVVKGASAVLFGESAPGGAVNVTQKKPTKKPQHEIFMEGGNNNLRGIGFDFSDKAPNSDNVRYRLVGKFKQTDGELSKTDNKRIYLAPSVAIDLSDDTMLTLLATYLKDDGTPTNGFFPASGTLIGSNYGKIKPSTNLGEPGYDKYKRTQLSVGYLLEHNINSTWRYAQRFNYGYNDLTLRSVYAFPNSSPTVSQLDRGIVFRDGKNQSITFDNNVVAEWDTNNMEHTLLAGFELQAHETKGKEQDNSKYSVTNPWISPINPWNPVYDNYPRLDPANNTDRKINKTQYSLYSQYQMKFDSQWIGVAGLRYDWVKTENKNQTLKQTKSSNNNQLSVNTGLMYVADNGLSPYANYSQSFEVQSTIDLATKELYKPLKGEQFELGVKYTPYFIDGYLNIAWFDIKQKNAFTTNPGAAAATQTGKNTSTGIEVDAAAQLTDNLNLKANYTYTNAKTDTTNGKGRRQTGLIPKHMASVWAEYDVPFNKLQNLKLGTGVRYLGESKDNPAGSNVTVPSATLWDMAATYDLTKQWQVQLNINNILDKEYVSACDYYCYFGQSRTLVLTTKYTW